MNFEEKSAESDEKINDKAIHIKPKKNKMAERDSDEKTQKPRLVSSRNSSRMLFADINV